MATRLPQGESHFAQYKQQAQEDPKNSRFTLFVLGVTFFGLINFFVINDIATIWPGAELSLLSSATGDQPIRYFPAWLLSQIEPGKYWLFLVRLPGALLFLFGLFVFGWQGRKIFGDRSIQFALLSALASFILPIQAKQATGDGFVFLGSVMLLLAAIYHVKEPTSKFKPTWVIAPLLMALADPLHGIIFCLVLYYFLWRLQPGAGGIWKWPPIYFSIVFGLVSILLMNSPAVDSPYLTWGMSPGSYFTVLGYSLLAGLPFFGFMLAAFRDLFYKLKKGEELSRILLIGLLASFLSQSYLFVLLLAFMIGKQLMAYFTEHYPWKDWVRTGAMLHLVGIFILVVIILVGMTLEGQGFRSALGFCAAYWMFSFMGVVGLFGMRADLTWAGPILAGVFSFLFFCLQLYPFWESERNWPDELLDKLNEKEVQQIYFDADEEFLALPYLNQTDLKIDGLNGQELLLNSYQNKSKGWYLVPSHNVVNWPVNQAVDSLQSTDHRLRSRTWYIFEQ